LISEGFPTRLACGNDSFQAKTYFEIGSYQKWMTISEHSNMNPWDEYPVIVNARLKDPSRKLIIY